MAIRISAAHEIGKIQERVQTLQENIATTEASYKQEGISIHNALAAHTSIYMIANQILSDIAQLQQELAKARAAGALARVSLNDVKINSLFAQVTKIQDQAQCVFFTHFPEARTTTATVPIQQPAAVAISTPSVTMTEVAVKFDAGYGNTLFVRGTAPGMSWESGIPLCNRGADSWVFTIPSDARSCEFKLVLNDTKFERGLNRRVDHNGQIVNSSGQVENPITPRFPH